MDFKVSFTHKECGEGIYTITAPMMEQMYLVTGERSAALIDTGMGIGSLRKYISSLTDLPLIVINTHGHPDHAGGNGEFSSAYLHKNDLPVFLRMCTDDFRISDIRKIFQQPVPAFENSIIPFKPNISELNDGQEIDLGGRVLKVIHTPGHTAGSVCLYDRNTGTLFSGDTISGPENWLFIPESTSVVTYYRSVKRIFDTFPRITQVLPGHLPVPIDADMIKRKMECALAICRGASGTPFETFAGDGLLFELNGAKLLYDPEKIYDDGEEQL